MRVPARFVLVILAIASLSAFCDQTSEIRSRISPNLSDDVEVVWIGVYVGEVHPESDAWSWTSVKSNEFSLEIPQTSDDIWLVALRRNFMPITTQLTQEMHNSEVGLDFKRGQQFAGTIVSTDGIGVANAVLTLERKEDSMSQPPNDAKFEWTSDADGAFSIGGLVPGNYTIQLGLPCVPRESFNFQVMDGEDNRREFVLANAYHIKGFVVDHVGEVVEGAEVIAELDPPIWTNVSGNVVLSTGMKTSSSTRFDYAHSNTLTTTSDSKGEFLLGPFADGQGLNISARHVDSGSTRNAVVFAGNHNISLVFSKMVYAFGTVVDAVTGQPIAQFTVEAYGRGKQVITQLNSNGRISAPIDSATTAMVVYAPKYAPFFMTDLRLDSMDEYGMGIVALDPGFQVTGFIFDEESRQPVQGATISSLGEVLKREPQAKRSNFVSRYLEMRVSAKSDAEGKFSLGPLVPDKSVLRVDAHGYKSEEVVVGSHAPTVDIGLSARDVRNTGIFGRIQTTDGEPVRGTAVFVEPKNRRSTTRRAKNDGSFEFLTHAGLFKVRAVSDRGRSMAVDVNVTDGETKEIVLEIDPTGRLIGTVTGLERAEGAYAMVLSKDRIVQSTGQVSNGDFVLEGIGFGAFTVRIQTTMNRQLERRFDLTDGAAEAHVEIAFAGDSRLFGKIYSLADTNTSRQVRAIGKTGRSLSGWSDILDDGSFEIRGLSDGEYWEEVGKESPWGLGKSDEESRRTRIEVVVSGDTELNFDHAAP